MINLSSISYFLLRFIVEEPIFFQSFSGFASCGIFYNLIKGIDESFAESLHSSKKLAPWSTSPIFVEFPSPSKIVYRHLPAPSVAYISFTIMDDKLCEIFKEAILKPNLYIDLIDKKAKVLGVSVNTHKFSDLVSNVNPLSEKFSIKFITPTVFRKSVYDCCIYCPHYVEYMRTSKEGKKLDKPCKYAIVCKGTINPLPIPSLMFKNLARMWSAFSGMNLDVWSTAHWAENAIAVAGFKKGIKTVRIYEHPTTNKWIVGFIGTVEFSIRKEFYKEKYAKIAAMLLKMAEMTNVGVRRTAGLGMIKYVPLNAKPRE